MPKKITSVRASQNLIAGSIWLRSVNPTFATAVLRAANPVRFPRGTLIYERGDPPGGVYGVVDGLVAASMDDAGNSVVAGHLFKPGDWFGEIPTVTNNVRAIDVMALRDCELLTIPLADLREICDSHPQGWRWLSVLVAINTGVAVQIARDLLIAQPRQRVISVIRRLIDTENLPFELAVTQTELAELCALSRGVVSRILGTLVAEDAVRLGYGTMTFLSHPCWHSDR